MTKYTRKRLLQLDKVMNMNLFNHNDNSADDYVQLNSCGC